MPIPGELKRKLAKKHRVTSRTINRWVKKRWAETGGTFDEKVVALSLAREAGMDIRPFCSNEEIEELRKLQSHQTTGQTVSIKKPMTQSTISKRQKAQGQIIKLDYDIGNIRTNLSKSEIAKAAEMTKAYYSLYIFENSVRQFIAGVMTQAHGPSWWSNRASSKLKKKVANRKNKDKENRWHSSRGAHEIFYTNIEDLANVISGNWIVFEPYFSRVKGGPQWIVSKLNEITLSRNIVAHNNPLEGDDRIRIGLCLRDWLRQIAAP